MMVNNSGGNLISQKSNQRIKYLIHHINIIIPVMGFPDFFSYFMAVFQEAAQVCPDFFHFVRYMRGAE